MQILDVARARGKFWAWGAVRRRRGAPGRWAPFGGTLAGARRRVVGIVREVSAEELEMLASTCVEEAGKYFEELRRDPELRRKWAGG